MKAAREKARGLKNNAKRVVPRRSSKKGQEIKKSVPQEPSTSLATYDEKQLLRKEREIFRLHDINLEVPRGQLCAIVGPVGAGKSSLVQGMTGGATLRLGIVKLTYKSQRCGKLVGR